MEKTSVPGVCPPSRELPCWIEASRSLAVLLPARSMQPMAMPQASATIAKPAPTAAPIKRSVVIALAEWSFDSGTGEGGLRCEGGAGGGGDGEGGGGGGGGDGGDGGDDGDGGDGGDGGGGGGLTG